MIDINYIKHNREKNLPTIIMLQNWSKQAEIPIKITPADFRTPGLLVCPSVFWKPGLALHIPEALLSASSSFLLLSVTEDIPHSHRHCCRFSSVSDLFSISRDEASPFTRYAEPGRIISAKLRPIARELAGFQNHCVGDYVLLFDAKGDSEMT